MAINPMQRKANNSFILGILVTLLITGLIIGFLILQLSKVNKEIEQMKATRENVYVLSMDVKSGEIITSSMLTKIEVDSSTIPDNAITVSGDLAGYSLCDKDGNEINIYIDNATKQSYYGILLPNSTNPTKLLVDDVTGKYYYEVKRNGGLATEKIYVEFLEQPLIAKVDMDKNTLLTSSLLRRGERLTDDVRTQEYNIISLPTQLTSGDFIDVRLRLPNGQDYIVVSRKEVTIPTISGIDSANCIWMDMTELETLTMSNAIVEAYKMNGAKIYATKYVEAGNQGSATPTYIPSDQVIALIESDLNIVAKAKSELYERMNKVHTSLNNSKEKDIIRNPINGAVNNEDAQDNLQDRVQEEIQGLKEEREQYLESLGM